VLCSLGVEDVGDRHHRPVPPRSQSCADARLSIGRVVHDSAGRPDTIVSNRESLVPLTTAHLAGMTINRRARGRCHTSITLRNNALDGLQGIASCTILDPAYRSPLRSPRTLEPHSGQRPWPANPRSLPLPRRSPLRLAPSRRTPSELRPRGSGSAGTGRAQRAEPESRPAPRSAFLREGNARRSRAVTRRGASL
jgi:hypothetical protein